MKNRFLIASTIMMLSLSNLSAIDLFLADNDLKGEINLDFSQGFYASYTDRNLWMLAPGFELEVVGEKDSVKIEGGLDFQAVFTGDYDEILKKAALYWEITDDLRLTLGQFKSPFGFENQRGQSKRAYLEHSASSKQIAPGYLRGASLGTKNLLSFIDGEFGLFSGGKITDDDSSLTKLQANGAVTMNFELSSIIDLMAGYSAFFTGSFLPAFYFQFGQSIALELSFNFGSKNDLLFFVEFMERLDDSLAINHNPQWAHGGFASLEYRISAFEPYLSVEFYKENLMLWTEDDLFRGAGGCNVYLEEDIRILGEYALSFYYIDSSLNHEIALYFFYSL